MKENDLIVCVHITKISIFGSVKTTAAEYCIDSGFLLIGEKFNIQKKINTETRETSQFNIKLTVFGIFGFQMSAKILPTSSLHCINC